MPDIKGTTRAQTIFLRSFAKSPTGPKADDWPPPAMLRRWLRRPGFVEALNSLRAALRVQADFQLLAAAASAPRLLQQVQSAESPTLDRDQLKAINELMKLVHLRLRFADEKKIPGGYDEW
jgi:hypothetical protein